MVTKLRIRSNDPLTWPKKCVICGAYEITTYRAYGSTFTGISLGIFGTKINLWKSQISYPICAKHKYITIVFRKLIFISFISIFIGPLVLVALLPTPEPLYVSSIQYLIFLASTIIIFLVSLKKQPVIMVV